MPSRQLGVSLVEVMVTIAILAIVVGVGLPAFNGWAQNRRLVGAAENIRAVVTYAQSEAVRTASSTQVTVTPGSTWVVQANTIPGKTVQSADYPQVSLALNSALFASGTITFEPKRAAIEELNSSSPDQIILTVQTDTNNQVYLRGGHTGLVSICTPNGVGGVPGC